MAEVDDWKLSGAEEYIAAEVELAEPLDLQQEKYLRHEFGKLDAEAFDFCDIDSTRISLCYDPKRTEKEDLLGLIKRSGGKLKHGESQGSRLL